MHTQAMIMGLLSVLVAVLIPGILLARLARRRWGDMLRITPRTMSLTVLVGSFALIMQSVGVYVGWIPHRGPGLVLDAVLLYGYAVLTVAFVTLLLPDPLRRRKSGGGGNAPPRDPST